MAAGAGRGRRPGDLRAARRHVLARRNLRRRDPPATRPGQARRDRDRARCRWPISPASATGVTTAWTCSPRYGATGRRTTCAGWWTRPIGSVSPCCSTWFTTTLARTATTWPSSLRDYFSTQHRTPWGPAVNLDGPGSAHVRAFFFENAVHWLREYHMDGLRLDATHRFFDDSPRHFLAELAAVVHESIGERHRPPDRRGRAQPGDDGPAGRGGGLGARRNLVGRLPPRAAPLPGRRLRRRLPRLPRQRGRTWFGRSTGAGCSRVSTRFTAATCAAPTRPDWRLGVSCSTSRITIGSATGRWASGSTSKSTRPLTVRPPRCC